MAALLLGLASAAQALDFQTIALSGTTALPFAAGSSTSYQFGLRQVSIAEDGWVGFAPGSSLTAAHFMVGEPGTVRRVVSGGESLLGSTVGALRSLRVDDGQQVALTVSLASAINTQLHYTALADGSGAPALVKVPSPATTAVYNRVGGGGSIGFELLPGGQQWVHASNSSGSSFEAGRLSAAEDYTTLVRTGSASTAKLALPSTGIAGVGTPASGRSWASVQAVGGTLAGNTLLYGLQVGSGITSEGVQMRGNLVELRADGSSVSIVHPGSTVPGAPQPFAGISAGAAQFAANTAGQLVFRGDFGRNTTFDRKLFGGLLRYDGSTLSILALPGAAVPGLSGVSFGHKILPDGATLSPLSMLPDNLVLDSARGLALNQSGTAAFVSAITGAPAVAGYGVFLSHADGSFATLATTSNIQAQLAPGASAGFAKFHDVALNDSGLAVFSATLVGGDSRQGLWYGHSAADLQLLVLEGQEIEVLPGVFKTVGNLDTGLHELMDTRITALDDGLNNAGQFAFSVTFTDGSEAVLRTALVSSVPEPASALLMLLGAGLLVLRRQRLPNISC
ncbi:DUF7453 family protein [Roseateles paludis]|uniref:Choice-of-anchor tandem repeat NxxGxxAF-containing protein n=1 Tax=Roseateles paludis TaxID=3145238 RepID=A0ABV0FYS0_9BURK